MGELILGAIRGLFMLLDKVVAFVITLSYDMILKLADVNVFNPEVVGMFGKRIYALLGIFMLFKLSFSLINYLINPDDFTAKDKGFGKIVTNVMTVILLIVMVPTIFEYAFKFQGEILKNGVMQKLILGVAPPEENETAEEIAEKDSKLINFAVFSAFYGPNKDIPAIGDKCNEIYATRILGYATNDITGCALAIKDALGSDADYNAVLYTFDSALKTNDINLLYDNSLADAKAGGKYLFDYKVIISTIVGGIVALILVQFCFDISIRAVKLGFLQLIAPIPIVSYIDPKSGKDGMFKKWYKETFKTFLDLFIRLAALFFAIFIISIVAQNKMTTYSDPDSAPNALIQIFVIVGALMFAKQTPKLIGDLTGLKLDGGFTLNPMKRLGAAPFVAGAAGIGIGGAATAFAKFNAHRNAGHGMKASLGSGLLGAFTGGVRGAKAGYGAAGKDIIGAATGVASKPAHKISKYAGTTAGERAVARLQTAAKIPLDADQLDAKVKLLDTYSKHVKFVEERAEAEIAKKTDIKAGKVYSYYDHKNKILRIDGSANDNVELLRNQIEFLKNSGASAADIATASEQYKGALKAAKENFIDKAISGGGDAVIRKTINEMNDLQTRNANELSDVISNNVTSAASLDSNKKATMGAKTDIEYSDKYKQAVKVRDAVKK